MKSYQKVRKLYGAHHARGSGGILVSTSLSSISFQLRDSQFNLRRGAYKQQRYMARLGRLIGCVGGNCPRRMFNGKGVAGYYGDMIGAFRCYSVGIQTWPDCPGGAELQQLPPASGRTHKHLTQHRPIPASERRGKYRLL
jgi:hypothetical protein